MMERKLRVLTATTGCYTKARIVDLLMRGGPKTSKMYDEMVGMLTEWKSWEDIANLSVFIATIDVDGAPEWLERSMAEVQAHANPQYNKVLVMGLWLGLFRTLNLVDHRHATMPDAGQGLYDYLKGSGRHIVEVSFGNYSQIGAVLPADYAQALEKETKQFAHSKAPNREQMISHILSEVAGRHATETEREPLGLLGEAAMNTLTYVGLMRLSVANRVLALAPLKLFKFSLTPDDQGNWIGGIAHYSTKAATVAVQVHPSFKGRVQLSTEPHAQLLQVGNGFKIVRQN